MQRRKTARAVLAALTLVFIVASRASAQEGEATRPQGGPPSRAEINYEVHLYLLVTAEAAEGAPKPPQALDAVVRQLKVALPPADYRLAAAFINRVKDGGSLEVRSMGFASPNPVRGANGYLSPTSFQLSLSGVKLIDPSSPQLFINIQQFRFGMKVPLQTAAVTDDKAGRPVIQYEDAGVSTMLSVRDGEPTLVGTLNTSGPGQNFVVVLTVRRMR